MIHVLAFRLMTAKACIPTLTGLTHASQQAATQTAHLMEIIMQQTPRHGHTTGADMHRVRTLEEVEYLIKESEVLTGQPGRTFVIASADQLRYRVEWHELYLKIDRLNEDQDVVSTQFMTPLQFATHSLTEALKLGQLLTPAEFN